MGAGLGVAIAGSYIKKESVRWFLPLPLLGIMGHTMLIWSTDISMVIIQREIAFFIPFFTIIGALIGEGVRRYLGETDWGWPLAYALLGLSAAAISQMRGEIQWLIVTGFVLGVAGWLFVNSRGRWVITLVVLGLIVSMTSMLPGIRFFYPFAGDAFWIAILILLGLIGWFGYKSNLCWIIAFFLMGTIAGISAIWTVQLSFLSIGQLLLSAVAGGVVGLLILPLPLSLRKPIVFGLFGAAAFCWLRITIFFMQFWARF